VHSPPASNLTGESELSMDFIANYVEITKGFMRLLKKGVPFCWEESFQCSFEVLKHALMSSPLLQPPNYNKYFLLYLVTVESTIDMVLVQEDDLLEENVIYYLIRGLVGLELNYSTTPMLRSLCWQQCMMSNGFVIIFYFARPPSSPL
jgi:hypothetical protein